jgi:hypothetical protein
MLRGKEITECKPRGEPRSERAPERKGALTCRELGSRLALFLVCSTTTSCRPPQGKDLLPATGEGSSSVLSDE